MNETSSNPSEPGSSGASGRRPPTSLNGSSRRAGILELVKRDGQVVTGDLARTFGVSAVTVHRDLQVLAEAGEIERVHGGARAKPSEADAPPTDWNTRLGRNTLAKRSIAELAATRVQGGSTVFLDASTSCLELARAISRRPPATLTVVTNSPVIAAEFREESVNVVVAPGELDQNARFIGGPWTTEFIGGLRFHSAFISAAGVTLQQGLGTLRRQLADLSHTVRDSSARTYALVDSSKFGTPGMLSVIDPRQLETLFTDDGLDPKVRDEYTAAGVELAIAQRNRRGRP